MSSVNLKRLCEEYLEPEESKHLDSPCRAIQDLPAPRIGRTGGSQQKESPLNLAYHSLLSFKGKKREELSELQQNSLKEMEAWMLKYTAVEMTKLAGHEVANFIQSYSRVFFLADLRPDMLDVKFVDTFEADAYFGYAVHENNGIQQICLDIGSEHYKRKNVKDHKTALLGTLFHECVHAYFAAFCCDNPVHLSLKDEDFSRCKLGDNKYDQGAGHFTAWFHLAAGVQLALDDWLDSGFDLAVFRSVSREYRAEHGAKHVAEEWKRLFVMFGWKGVDRLVSKLSEEDLKNFGPAFAKHGGLVRVLMEEYRKMYGGV